MTLKPDVLGLLLFYIKLENNFFVKKIYVLFLNKRTNIQGVHKLWEDFLMHRVSSVGFCFSFSCFTRCLKGLTSRYKLEEGLPSSSYFKFLKFPTGEAACTSGSNSDFSKGFIGYLKAHLNFIIWEPANRTGSHSIEYSSNIIGIMVQW